MSTYVPRYLCQEAGHSASPNQGFLVPFLLHHHQAQTSSAPPYICSSVLDPSRVQTKLAFRPRTAPLTATVTHSTNLLISLHPFHLLPTAATSFGPPSVTLRFTSSGSAPVTRCATHSTVTVILSPNNPLILRGLSWEGYTGACRVEEAGTGCGLGRSCVACGSDHWCDDEAPWARIGGYPNGDGGRSERRSV